MSSDKTPERRQPRKANHPQTDPADQELFRRYVECGSDRRASDLFYTQIWDNFHDEVLTICTQVLHKYHDAEDAAQDTFLVLHRRRKTVRPDNLRSFLHGIALRCALNIAGRRRPSKRLTEELEELLFAHAADVPDLGLREERLKAVWDAVDRLSQIDRAAIISHFAIGVSTKEMADSLHIRPETLRKRFSRAFERLRETLREAGFEVPPPHGKRHAGG